VLNALENQGAGDILVDLPAQTRSFAKSHAMKLYDDERNVLEFNASEHAG